MITRFASLYGRVAVTLAFLFTITACGGGGGGGGSFYDPDAETDGTYFVSIAIYDPVGNPTNTVTTTEPGSVEVTVTKKNAKGAPIGNAVVNVTLDAGLIFPATGRAVTDGNGIARFRLEAGEELGGGTLTATVDSPAGTAEGSTAFQVGLADLRLGYFDGGQFIEGQIKLNATSLPTGGSALLLMSVVDENDQPVSSVEDINLISPCVQSGLAKLPATVSTLNGQATATYTATGCDGEDTITATLVNVGAQARGTVTVAAPTVNAVQFVSVEPAYIALKGTGGAGRKEVSKVTFEVVDGGGSPLAGVAMQFALSTEVGGLKLGNTSSFTDGNGQASTTVIAGNVPTSVRVEASIQAQDDNGNTVTLTNISDILVVSTGLPDQNSISLSASTLKIAGAQELDGVTVTVTVRMGDGYNNPVPDGTAAYFTTEYGVIGDSCVTTDGSCDVTWTSQSPRFPDQYASDVRTIFGTGYRCPSISQSSGPCPDDLGYIRGMRSTISVTAIGNETFTDADANGLYSEGEFFVNMPEAFLDKNEDGAYTPAIASCINTNASSSLQCKAGVTEESVDLNGNGVYDFNVDAAHPQGWYNGTLCPIEGDGIYCSRELINVRDDLVLTLATDINLYSVLVRGSTPVGVTQQGQSYMVYISDRYNNSPAAGATVSLSADGTGNTSDTVDDCEIVGQTSFDVPEGSSRGAFGVPLQTTGRGTVTVSVAEASWTFGCNAPEPPADGDTGTPVPG